LTARNRRRENYHGASDVRASPVPFESFEFSIVEFERMTAIAHAIDARLASIGRARGNLSFVIDCRAYRHEVLWPLEAKRRICAALERRYLQDGWKQASIYVMEHRYLRLRVTLRA
jgi:hypothetical protein